MTEMKKGSVLVVEDDLKNMKLMRAVLELKGNYTVHEAVNAEEGIEKAYEYHPDVILMDIQLPGIDGLSATRLIKLDSDLKDIPVVAVSANAMQRDEEKAIAAGCDGYISKPIDVKNFVDTLEQYMQ
jgi:CheY-like chemotaxis protein